MIDSGNKLEKSIRVSKQITSLEVVQSDDDIVGITYNMKDGSVTVTAPSAKSIAGFPIESYNEMAMLMTAFSAFMVGLERKNMAALAGYEVLQDLLVKISDKIVNPDESLSLANMLIHVGVDMGLFEG